MTTTTNNAEHLILAGPNDLNGNPRRVSILIRNGVVIAASDHGFAGPPRAWGGSIQIPVLVGQYRDRLLAALTFGFLYDADTAPAPADIPNRPDSPTS